MVVYKDIDNFGKEIENKEAVLNYINNLLSIKVGEIPFKRKFGSYIEKYLFEPFSFITAKKIELEIERVISIWLPMVSIEDIKVDMDIQNQKYKIIIYIKIEKIEDIIIFETEKFKK